MMRLALAMAIFVAAGASHAQERLPLPDVTTVPPPRATAHPPLRELYRSVPPVSRQDDDREPDLTAPRTSRPVPPRGLQGDVRVSSAQERRPIARLSDIYGVLRSCWVPPRGSAPSGNEVTVRFSFNRSGAILGKPRITYYKAAGSADDQQRFRRSVIDALDRCTPLPFTQEFGSAIAGRPFSIRFIDDQPA
jgi:hypothetical protein